MAIDLIERREVVVSDVRRVVTCPFCGFKTSKVHDTRRVRIKDLPALDASERGAAIRGMFDGGPRPKRGARRETPREERFRAKESPPRGIRATRNVSL
jgi:hypothetical protein